MAKSEKTIDDVIAEYVQAAERGSPPEPTEFLRKYPQFRAELNDFIELHGKLTASGQIFRTSASSLSGTQAMLDGSARILDPRPSLQHPHRSSFDVAKSPSGDGGSVASHPPKFLADYEILEEIDRGGMGVVYKARHQRLNRIVALKLIRSGELASEEEVRRFMREAEAAAALTHPGIVPIYEVGQFHGLVYYTMAYIEGDSLADIVAQGAMDPADAVRITHKLCVAVEFAHQSGIYHRDLKPANVLINEHGQPVIIDFGLAKVVQQDQSLTATGQILGTPAYMTPEHASGREKDAGPAADVYALGAILYCLCAGQPAFSGPTPFDVLLQVLDRRPPNPSKLNKRVSKEIDVVCLRSLEKQPELRYPTATALAADLQRILKGEMIDKPQENIWQSLIKWWQREPILVAHVAGIGTTMLIVVAAYILRAEFSELFYYRLGLLSIWLAASFALQYWVYRAPWTHVAIFSWLAVDALIYTTLIAFARPPRSMLLIGYPMMIVASALHYQRRFTVTKTALCILGFMVLGWRFPLDDFVKLDFSAIFVCGLTVICLCLIAMINRVRGFSRFYEE